MRIPDIGNLTEEQTAALALDCLKNLTDDQAMDVLRKWTEGNDDDARVLRQTVIDVMEEGEA